MNLNKLIAISPKPYQKAELVVNFSGGKDSTAMLAWLCEHYPDVPKHVIMADTGWEHSDAIAWSEAMVARFGLPLHVVRNPNKDFFAMVRHRKMFPSPKHRQCTSDLKRGPIQTWIRQNLSGDKLIVNCMGLRAEESPARAKQPELKLSSMSNGRRTVMDWLPIHQWKWAEVMLYLAMNDLPLHPVYKYLRRFSCQVCIFATQRDLQQTAIHNPNAIRLIMDLEAEIGFSMKPEGFVKDLIALPEKTRSNPFAQQLALCGW